MPQNPINVRGTELLAGDSRELYRQKLARITLDSMVQFVGLLDAQGTVLEINSVALDAVGITLADVEGKPFWTTFWWQVSDEINATLRDALRRAAQGEFVRWDAEIFGRSGGKETIIIDASLMPVTNEQGKVVFITAEGRDITEKKAHEREIARQREELAKLDVLKTQFFANISHEFRTPLTLMLGPLQEASADAIAQAEGPLAENLSTAHRNALRLQKLVNAMLDFSRIEAGRAQASYRATNLPALTTDLASSFESLCEKAGLRLIVNCHPFPKGKTAYVDTDMWEKIVLNLLSNAFKFTLEGEIEVTLAIAARHARLTVRDTGVGIPPEEVPRMFERFHRIEDSRGRTNEGTGIGLALVQELVRLHGGAISVESAVGKGSAFIVSIPLGKAHLDPNHLATGAAPSPAAAAHSAFVEEALRWLPDQAESAPPLTEKPIPGDKPLILWADDNSDMRSYVARLLSRRFHVHAVPDGEAALQAAKAHPPDLILSDVMMPKVDGFSLLTAVRADPALREIPVILLSARAGEESRIEGMEAGADDYLVKPFTARELTARVETHTKIARTRQEMKRALAESENRFKTIANTAPAILWITAPDGSCSFLSARWFTFTGQTATEALGFGWLNAVHPHDRETAREAIREAAANRGSFSFDSRLRSATGEYCWFACSGRPRFDHHGLLLGFTGSGVEIHDRKIAALESALLSTIVESCDDAIISKDLNGIITSWNPAAERMFGYTAAEAVGQSIRILIPSERQEEEENILAQIRRGESIEHFETVRKRKDGSRLHISLTISPLKNPDGRITGASKVARDITERIRHEEALLEANAALKRANADLRQFAYSASHDLQEPLRMVALYSQLLQERFASQLGPEGEDYLTHTVQGALRMESLLRDLRIYLQVSTATHELDAVSDSAAVLETALAKLEQPISESGAVITHAQLPQVRIAESQLQHVFENLIANAILYRREPPRISITAALQNGMWRFCVQDNGIGIEPEYYDQIFGVFKRLHSATEYPGTGMGLAICQRIIERAGGRIWLESEFGKGSTFFFTLPPADS